MTAATILPTMMPSTMPMTPPASPMMTDSSRNWDCIFLEEAPSAFRVPISRVLSLTDTSMMFIRPTAAPVMVMSPIITAAAVSVLIIESSSSTTASLRVIRKSVSSYGASLLTARKTISASAAASSGDTSCPGSIPMVKSGEDTWKLAMALV